LKTRTVFDTPGVVTVCRWLAKVVLKLTGWQIQGQLPPVSRFILIAAPHTSVWDGIYMVLVALVFGVKMRWLGKHTLFRKPFGIVIRWLGGLPVDRSAAGQNVDRVVKLIQEADEIVLAVPTT